MNIQRFILPATIAATVHVALLWALPREEYVRLLPVDLGPVDPPPPPPEPVVEPPAPDITRELRPVQKTRGGPPPPELPENLPTLDKAVVTIPVDPRPGRMQTDIKRVPEISGPGEGGLEAPAGPVGPGVFTSLQLDRPPNARVRIPPDYPTALKHAGVTGSVLVEFTVDPAGEVASVRMVRSTDRAFEEPTLRAVRRWKFEPGRVNGAAVSFRLQIPVDFLLE